MDNKKEETNLDRVKALASRIKGGDEQLTQDCLDFADFPPESRKEALELIKGKKDKKDEDKKEEDKKVEDKAPKATKDDDVVPPPPPPPADDPKKDNEAAAPAASATAAPTQNPDDQPAPPPADVASPKDGEKPSEDKAPAVTVCDKCGKPVADCSCGKTEDTPAKDCGDKAVKDCGTPPAQGATEPTAQAPVSAIQAMAGEEKKDEGKKEDTPAKDCGDKAPETVEIKVEKVEEPKPGEAIAAAIEGKETEDQSADARIKADVKADHDNVPPGKTAKVAQDEYVAFVAEYTAAQALASKLRPYIKDTFDSAPMREIEVARFAAKNIDNLAFVADEADDEKVLLAVRGYAAAIAMDAAPVVADAPTSTKPDLVDTPPTADAIVQDEAPTSTAGADIKGLAAFLNN